VINLPEKTHFINRIYIRKSSWFLIVQKSKIIFHPEAILIADSGYQGIQKQLNYQLNKTSFYQSRNL
jgi:hypothetical protein